MVPTTFWSAEVEAESPVTIELDSGIVLHISQTALDKGNIKIGDIITLCVRIGNKRTVVGSLSATCRQFMCDLIFDKEVELSHDWKNGSVHFSGYFVDLPGVFPNLSTEPENESDSDYEHGTDDISLAKGASWKVSGKVKPQPYAKKDMVDSDSENEDEYLSEDHLSRNVSKKVLSKKRKLNPAQKTIVSVKWQNKTFPAVEIDTIQPPYVFKVQLYDLTGVPPEKQTIMVKGGLLKDDADWSKLGVKQGQKLMMMGTADEILKAPEKSPVFMEDLPEEEQAVVLGHTAGLFNLGNTCYMNSTVQCLHSVPELKSAMIK